MADTKISALTAYADAAAVAAGDLFVAVDVSDTTMAASGTDKRLTGSVLADAVASLMTSGTLAAAKLVGTDIATVGTVTTGTWNATAVALAHGGTGATTAAGARTNLGLVIGTDVLAPSGDGSGLTGISVGQVSGALAAANDLSDLADAATARTNLGLGSAATHAAGNFCQTLTLNTSGVVFDAVAFANPGAAGNFFGSLSLRTQAANAVFAGPATGADATPTFRGLVAGDLPATAVTPGSYTNADITVDAAGRVTAASNGTGGGGGSGTVTSVGLSLPSILTVSGSPVTTTGTLTGTLATQTANYVWAGPTTGTAAAPTFRALVAADIPDLSGTYLTGNQTVTLSGDVSGSGTTAITTAIGAGKVTNAMLAGSIAASKLVGTDITLTESQVTNLTTDLAAKAPLASPTFSGTVAIGTLDGVLKGTSGNVGVATEGTDYLSGASNKLPLPFSWGGGGTPTTGGKLALYAGLACTAIRLQLTCLTAPSGGAFQVTIERGTDGSTYPDTIGSVSVSSGATFATGTTFTNSAIAAGDYLRITIDSVNGAADWGCRLDTLSRNQ